jgi:glutamyl-tRNA synthetase
MFGAYPEFVRFFFEEVEPDTELLDPKLLREAEETLAGVEPFTAEPIEAALRGLADRVELSPRKAFQPIRVAVTGSRVSPGLFESLELLGKEKSLARLRAAASELA